MHWSFTGVNFWRARPSTARVNESAGLLGDTPSRDYAAKLRLFNAFAEPEVRAAIAGFKLAPGMRVLDAGCGTGEALHWLWDAVKPHGAIVGVDLAAAHVAAARKHALPSMEILQADLLDADLQAQSFDFIWCVNTVHHLRSAEHGVRRLAALLRPGGRLVLGQTALLPDMFFAWDSRLERAVHDAVRRYYLERYSLDERGLAGVRSMLGVLRAGPFREVSVHTRVIERVTPLAAADRAYLLEAIFRQTWGDRLRPYLDAADAAQLHRICDPQDSEFALRRPDFHFLQTFTTAVGEVQRPS
jgi:SAM-dependent methyltransferase